LAQAPPGRKGEIISCRVGDHSGRRSCTGRVGFFRGALGGAPASSFLNISMSVG
jgi:hypothetical protein